MEHHCDGYAPVMRIAKPASLVYGSLFTRIGLVLSKRSIFVPFLHFNYICCIVLYQNQYCVPFLLHVDNVPVILYGLKGTTLETM